MEADGSPAHSWLQHPGMKWLTPLALPTYFTRRWQPTPQPVSPLASLIYSPLPRNWDSHFKVHLNFHTHSDSLLYNNALIPRDGKEACWKGRAVGLAVHTW